MQNKYKDIDTTINQITDYLEKHDQCKKTDINIALGLKKTTATYYYQEMVRRGLIDGNTPKGKPVKLLTHENNNSLDEIDLLNWQILYVLRLSNKPITLKKLEEKIIDIFGDKIPSLDYRVKKLSEAGYIFKEEREKTNYAEDNNSRIYCSVTGTAPFMAVVSEEELSSFLSVSGSYGISGVISDTVEEIKWILELDDSTAEQQILYGKRDNIKKESLKQLVRLFSIPYRSKVIKIYYISRNGELLSEMETGAILYSGETNEYYVLGKDQKQGRFLLVRLSSIYKFEETEKENSLFGSDEVKKITDAMISMEITEPMNVKIRFRNKPWIKERLEYLRNERKNAVIDFNYKDGKEILYTENGVIGFGGLHRFVRFFGPNVIVEEPLSLRERMILTAKHVDDLYNGGDKVK